MARGRGAQNELIKCDYCGEMYAASYKHCPFCNEDGTGRWNDPEGEEDYEDRPRGGKRLAGTSHSGGGGPSVRQIIGWVLSLALIIAAAGIVFSILKPLLGLGKDKEPQPDPTASAAVSAVPSAAPSAAVPTAPAEETTPAPAVSQVPAPQVTTPSVELIAPTSFKLSKDDITLDHAGEIYTFKVTYTPADARGDITWTSSNPNVVSVSWNGTVTAVSQGTATVTATVAGAGEKSCIVRCNFKDGAPAASAQPAQSAAPAESQTGASAGNLKLSREDFTLAFAGDKWRLVVSGTGSAVTWASSDEGVATVGADGTVTAVSKGTCKVTATVDGTTLSCIVRCNF